MKNKPITNIKINVRFVDNSPTQIEEKDVVELHNFFMAVIKMGLNNKDVPNNFWEKLAS